MIKFSDSERTYHAELQGLATDGHGREILAGLSVEESEFYVNFSRTRDSGERTPADRARYLELHERHERARLQAVCSTRH